jgi:GAF domain-containing protein
VPRTGYDREPVLRAVARTTAACLGYGTAVINLYRPAWDDFHTVVVEGSEEARRVLLGQTSTADDWTRLLDARFERRGAFLIEHGAFDSSLDRLTSYLPRARRRRTWAPAIPRTRCSYRCARAPAKLLGILSVDEPTDARRPGDEQLDLLVGMSQHAALALEHA